MQGMTEPPVGDPSHRDVPLAHAYLPPGECTVGHAYLIRSRNLAVGVYRGGDDGGFIGRRTKFGDTFLFTEYHWDLGGVFGTVQPVADLGPCPVRPLEEHLGTRCDTCRQPVVYQRFGREREVDGRLVPGRWQHAPRSGDVAVACAEVRPRAVGNDELFSWLGSLEAEHRARCSACGRGYFPHTAAGADHGLCFGDRCVESFRATRPR